MRTILLSTISDHILSTQFEVLGDGTRRLSEVRLRMYTQLVTRARRTSATESDLYCESFRYTKSVDNGGLAQDGVAAAIRSGAVALDERPGCSKVVVCQRLSGVRESQKFLPDRWISGVTFWAGFVGAVERAFES